MRSCDPNSSREDCRQDTCLRLGNLAFQMLGWCLPIVWHLEQVCWQPDQQTIAKGHSFHRSKLLNKWIQGCAHAFSLRQASWFAAEPDYLARVISRMLVYHQDGTRIRLHTPNTTRTKIGGKFPTSTLAAVTSRLSGNCRGSVGRSRWLKQHLLNLRVHI